MENMLLKLARQLDSLDEASLMALWSKYANIVSRFEPSKRWEESCLVFSLIQAKRWKNQLFNYNWSQQRQAPMKDEQEDPDININFSAEFEGNFDSDASLKKSEENEPCRILPFRRLPQYCQKKDLSAEENEPK